jgi:hypothetical protein
MKAYASSTSGVTSITVLGYAAANDMGGAVYVPATGSLSNPNMYVQTKDGAKWMISNSIIRPEMFGGFPDNTTDCEGSLTYAIMYGRPICLQSGTYRIMSNVLVNYPQMRTHSISITGQGAGVTTINIPNTNPYSPGLYINYNGTATQVLTSVTLSNFSIGRTNPNGYTGTIGPKSLSVSHANNVLVSGIEEYGAIGFGIGIGYCDAVEVRNCYSHDHKGGSAHWSGADGIDIWYGTNINAHDNTVIRVGDDGLSFVGAVTNPDRAITCKNNTLNDISGAINIFGTVSGADVSYNTCSACIDGGVNIWIDSHSTDVGGTISGINIHDNTVYSCGGAGATGGIGISASGGTVPQAVTGVTMNHNTINTSPAGVCVFSVAPAEMFSNLTITNNIINSCGTGILVGAVNNNLTISGNTILNSTKEGIATALSNGTESVGMGSGTYLIQNNDINNFMSSGGSWVRPGGIAIGSGTPSDYTISLNTITDPQVTSAQYFGIYSLIGLSKTALLSANPGLNLTNTRGVYTGAP